MIEHGPKDKRSVAWAVGWPGLERGAKDEDAAVERLVSYVPRYRRVADRAGLAEELDTLAEPKVIGDYVGTGSTDFWGISFAPAEVDREPYDAAKFERDAALLRAAWAEFDDVAARVSAELRLGPRGGGRQRDRIIRHVLGQEGGDFFKRVKVPAELEDLATPEGRAMHRDRFIDAMRAWYADGKPLGNWTIPYLLRHTAYHVLDHTWEMEDRDLTAEGASV